MYEIDLGGSELTLETVENILLASKVGETEILIKNISPTNIFTFMKDVYGGIIKPTETQEQMLNSNKELSVGDIVKIGGQTIQVKKIRKSEETSNYILLF